MRFNTSASAVSGLTTICKVARLDPSLRATNWLLRKDRTQPITVTCEPTAICPLSMEPISILFFIKRMIKSILKKRTYTIRVIFLKRYFFAGAKLSKSLCKAQIKKPPVLAGGFFHNLAITFL